MKYVVLISLFCLSALGGPVLALSSADPKPNVPILVLGWPGTDLAGHVTLAGGYLVGPIAAPMGVLATSDDPGFAARLEQVPGLFLRDGERLAALCGVDL